MLKDSFETFKNMEIYTIINNNFIKASHSGTSLSEGKSHLR